MASYHFPIIVGNEQENRIVLVHLFELDNNSPYSEKRIIFTSSNQPLFKVLKEFTLVNDDGEVQKNIKLGITAKQTTEISLSKIKEQEHNDNDFIWYTAKGITKENPIELSFKCTINKIEFIGNLTLLYIPNPSRIAHTNIDLGSDVTQVSTFLGANFPEHQDLIELFKKKLSYEWERKYLSQNHKDYSFYRTGNILYKKNGKLKGDYINFLSLNLEGLNAKPDKTKLGKVIDNFVDYKTYPNIKVIYQSQLFGNLFDFKDGKRLTNPGPNNFHRILAEIYKRIIENIEHTSDFRSILILVPNIYGQLQIEKISYELSCALNKGGKHYYDIRTISESDAAFLGYFSNANGSSSVINRSCEYQKDLFLVIDTGRGTTDASVISNKNNSLSAIKRGGIVGAGSAIDCLFAYIFAKHLYTTIPQNQREREDSTGNKKTITCENFQELFFIWFSKLPSGPKETLRLEIEQLKVLYETKNNTTIWKPSLISTQAIENILKRQYDESDTNNANPFTNNAQEESLKLDDEDSCMIESLCTKIAKETATRIGLPEDPTIESWVDAIDFVVYTGRSFEFEPLYNAFEQTLEPYRGLKNKKPLSKLKKTFTNMSRKNLIPIKPSKSKQETINFHTHNLQINLNSDLCCLDDIFSSRDFNKGDDRTISQKEFFEGFNLTDGQKLFYLGYYGEDQVWAPAGKMPLPPTPNPGLKEMTLFPNCELDKGAFNVILNLLQQQQQQQP